MKNTFRSALVLLLAGSSTALAAADGAAGGIGWLTILFLTFGAVVILFQAVPGLILFFSLLKGIFSFSSRKTAPAVSMDQEKKS